MDTKQSCHDTKGVDGGMAMQYSTAGGIGESGQTLVSAGRDPGPRCAENGKFISTWKNSVQKRELRQRGMRRRGLFRPSFALLTHLPPTAVERSIRLHCHFSSSLPSGQASGGAWSKNVSPPQISNPGRGGGVPAGEVLAGDEHTCTYRKQRRPGSPPRNPAGCFVSVCCFAGSVGCVAQPRPPWNLEPCFPILRGCSKGAPAGAWRLQGRSKYLCCSPRPSLESGQDSSDGLPPTWRQLWKG